MKRFVWDALLVFFAGGSGFLCTKQRDIEYGYHTKSTAV